MSIENEYKIVLSTDDKLYYHLAMPNNGFKHLDLTQGYLKNGDRIRKTVNYSDNTKKFEFNAKFMTSKGLLEIETEISEDDFELMENELLAKKLIKTRFEIVREFNNLECIWAIDYFRNADRNIYFAMAEVEYDGPFDDLLIIPEIVPYITYIVPHEQNDKFTSAKLNDIKYAKNLLKIIQEN